MRPDTDGTIPAHQPHCLGCGPENPASMGLRLRVEGERVIGEVRFDRRQEGAPGIAHGGAVATVIDDTIGSLLIVLGRPAVTANLNIDFRAPALLGRPLRVDAHCERIDGRKLHLIGTLSEGSQVLATGRALFIVVDLDHFRQGGRELPASWEKWGTIAKGDEALDDASDGVVVDGLDPASSG